MTEGPSDADVSEYWMPYLPFLFSICRTYLCFINAMVCSLPSAVLHAASLQQAALVNYFSQMLSFGHIQPFLPPTTRVRFYELGGAGTPFPCVPRVLYQVVGYYVTRECASCGIL